MEYVSTIQKFLFHFLDLDTAVLDSTQENFANINLTDQMKLNMIDEVWNNAN